MLKDLVKVSIVLPVYNEAESILQELEIIKRTMDASSYAYEVIVVDDCSTDRTYELIKDISWIKLIRHPYNKGAGASRRIGTLNATGNVAVWTDIDMTYPNHLIPQLIDYLIDNNFDQVIGMRTSEQGTKKILRIPVKWSIQKLASFLAGSKILDLNSGFRVFKRDVAKKFLHLLPDGFSCASTITLSFLCNGYTVGYYPIEYRKRIGTSKFHPLKDSYNYLIQVIRTITFFNPIKIFIPISLMVFLLGVCTSIRNLIVTKGLQQIDIILFIFSFLIFTLGLLADLIVQQSKRVIID